LPERPSAGDADAKKIAIMPRIKLTQLGEVSTIGGAIKVLS
jgi:hypothetical protein